MQLAVHCQKPIAAEWLVARGADYTVLDAWDLNWKDLARHLLINHPETVNHRYGEWDKTLLHFAAERNDEELTHLALSAGPDLDLKDKAYQGTALGWAQHMGHPRIVEIIAAHQR